ncbi:MAG: NTP transferase domain-containing protein [Actinomycetaceae bacterium]|nr:NTP transferase domain-containing protein [Actinomycetaceae bacterium]
MATAESSKVAAVVILAAGAGTRMKTQLPKPLHVIAGRTLLGHAIAAARGVNPDYVVVVVRHEGEKVARKAMEIDPEVTIAWQDDVAGTGRALWCGLQQLPADLSGRILVMAGDTPLLDAQVLRELAVAGDGVATVATTFVKDPTGYGRVLRDENGVIRAIVEHKDADEVQLSIREVNTSTYCFDLPFLRHSLSELSTDNAQGEMYLTDVVTAAYQSGMSDTGYVVADSMKVEGANDLVQLADLAAEMNRRICERWMRLGAKIVDPRTTHIDADVVIEPDTVIEPGTDVLGHSVVKSGAHIGPGLFQDTVIESGAVAQLVAVRGGHVGAGDVLSPFTAYGYSRSDVQ